MIAFTPEDLSGGISAAARKYEVPASSRAAFRAAFTAAKKAATVLQKWEPSASDKALDARRARSFSRGGSISGSQLLVLDGPDSWARDVVADTNARKKSRVNLRLKDLDGLAGAIRRNRKNTCTVLTVGAGSGQIRVGFAADLGMSVEALNARARDGRAWWCKTTNGGGNDSLWVTVEGAE